MGYIIRKNNIFIRDEYIRSFFREEKTFALTIAKEEALNFATRADANKAVDYYFVDDRQKERWQVVRRKKAKQDLTRKELEEISPAPAYR